MKFTFMAICFRWRMYWRSSAVADNLDKRSAYWPSGANDGARTRIFLVGRPAALPLSYVRLMLGI